MTNNILIKRVAGADGDIGQIILNRPQQLNVLDYDMCQTIKENLQQWQIEDKIKAVIIKSSSDKAFCAGGDLKAIYQNGHIDHDKAEKFFNLEYQMNKTLYNFKKPYIAFLNGITMGGGAGISVYGSHRIATENFSFAMPETAIGFFPDIGASSFLTRMPHHSGWYLGLTGNTILATDALYSHIITHQVQANNLEHIEQLLIDTPFTSTQPEIINDILKPFDASTLNSGLEKHSELIDAAFQLTNLTDIIDHFSQSKNGWHHKILDTLSLRSPLSLKVTYQRLKKACVQDFNEIIGEELFITKHFLNSHDFPEGIRAVLIDKDKKPKWSPNHLDEVIDEVVDQFFP